MTTMEEVTGTTGRNTKGTIKVVLSPELQASIADAVARLSVLNVNEKRVHAVIAAELSRVADGFNPLELVLGAVTKPKPGA